MPVKSKAQRRKFAELLVEGKISEEVFERWNRDAGRRELPERVTPKKSKSTASTKTKSKSKSKATTTRSKASKTTSASKSKKTKRRR